MNQVNTQATQTNVYQLLLKILALLVPRAVLPTFGFSVCDGLGDGVGVV
jgi:hypothetical protein